MHISLNEQRITTLGHAPCVVQPERMFQNEKRAHRTLPQNYVTLFVNGGPGGPRVQWRPRLHSLLSATMQTGRSLESSQIQDCSSGKLSKAFHTSTATVTAIRRELCFRKAKKNHNHNNNIMNVNKPGSDGRPHSSLLRAPG